MKKIYKIKVNNKTYRVELESVEEVESSTVKEVKKVEETKKEEVKKEVTNTSGNVVVAPIQGNVQDIKVKVGDHVKKGQCLFIIEAMKLENEVLSAYDGEVVEIITSKGKLVQNGEQLLIIK